MTTPKEYTFSFRFTHIPPVMLRGTHALIVVQDHEGKYILGSKHIYPSGIYRLVGGGIEANEDPQLGATRELQEELGIDISAENLTKLATIIANVSDSTQEKVFTTHLFHTNVGLMEIQPDDDLDGVVRFSAEEMEQLVVRYNELTDEQITLNKKYGDMPNTTFSWKDYGMFYGKVHEIALELTA